MKGAAFLALRRDPVYRAVVAAVLLFGTAAAAINPYQSLIAIEVFGLTDNAYSALLATAAVFGVAASIGAGILTDQRWSRRRVALAAAALVPLAALLVLTGPAPAAFVLAHGVLLPLGMSIYGQLFALSRLTSGTHPAEARDGMAALTRATFALPWIAVLPLIALLLGAGAPLIVVYVAALIGGAGGLAVLARGIPEDDRAPWTETKSGLSLGRALAEIARPRILVRAALCGGAMAGPALYMTLTGLIFAGVEGRGTPATALFTGLVAGLEVPFMLAIASLGRGRPRAAVIAVGTAIHACFLASFPLVASSPLVWLMTVPAALGASVVLSVPIVYGQELMADRPGAGSSLMSLMWVSAQGVTAAVFALGTSLGGYGHVAAIGGLVVFASGVSLWLLDRLRPMPAAA